MRTRSRVAFTLIELLVVMTAGVTILMLTIGMIQKTMKIASTNQARMDESLVTDRLIREFRHDAHRASSFQIEQDVQLALPDGSVIRYRAQGSLVIRDQSLDGKPVASNQFDLGENRVAAFDSQRQPDRVQLMVQRMIPEPRTDRSVVAVVGRWTEPGLTAEASP